MTRAAGFVCCPIATAIGAAGVEALVFVIVCVVGFEAVVGVGMIGVAVGVGMIGVAVGFRDEDFEPKLTGAELEAKSIGWQRARYQNWMVWLEGTVG